ncbi:MAG: aldo/keto reductase [Myxococcota bacterium]|nr:aldo/keto reductase [Myxococcota bacterium]
MPRRALGRTGLEVSIVGLGAGRIGEASQDERAIERLLHGALDRGVNVIDTARSYGCSEERLGRLLGARRDEYVLSTKVGYGVDGVPDWTARCVREGIDAALARMGTDRVDLVFLHSCPRDVLERGEVVEALRSAVTAGKVRAAGYSGENEELAWALASGAFEVVQCSVSLADQRALRDALPLAQQRSVGVLAKRPLADFAFRHEARPVADDVAIYWERLRAMALDGAREAPAIGWGELALRFTAFAPGVDTAIVGTSSLTHLDEALEWASRGPLEAERVRAIAAAFDAQGAGWRGVV